MASKRKLNASQVAAVEKHYGNLEAARAEFVKLKAEQAAHNANQAAVLAGGGKVLYLHTGGKFELLSAADAMTDPIPF